jgi:AraC-like DNA-binding protein
MSDDPRASGLQVFQFSTAAYRPHERIAAWREVFGRGMVRVDIEPLSQGPFRAEAILQALPGVRTGSVTGSPTRLTRTRAMATDVEPEIGLVVNLGAKAVVAQRGQEVMLSTGDAFPMLTDAPSSLISTGHQGILVPRAALAARIRDFDAVTRRAVPRACEPLRLLVRYLSLVQEETALASPTLRQTVVDHIHDLAALALGANRETKETSKSAVAAARLHAIKDDIRRNISHPNLSVHAIAARHRVSARYLQMLFEESGSTFTRCVLEQRLAAAHKALVARPDATISSIAYDAGFNDIANFNRVFRQHFGCTPSDVRQAAFSRADGA